MKHHLVEYSALRMTLSIHPCHGKNSDSQNRPNCWLNWNRLIFSVKDRDRLMSWMERCKQLFTFMKLIGPPLLTHYIENQALQGQVSSLLAHNYTTVPVRHFQIKIYINNPGLFAHWHFGVRPWDLDGRSGMSREVHVPFCKGPGLKSPVNSPWNLWLPDFFLVDMEYYCNRFGEIWTPTLWFIAYLITVQF